ncbi:MAG: hypothetical protein K8R48_02565 [Alphaproteobacteria bacterium]|nr:hypothetical protein [Alphaproteobacteria bacterium]
MRKEIENPDRRRRHRGAAALAVVLALGFLLPAQAFAQCEQFATANLALTALAAKDTSNLTDYVSQEKSFIEKTLSKTSSFEMEARLEEFDGNINAWLADWWKNRLQPSMKDMTKQLSVTQIQQTMTVGMVMDAQLVDETLKKKEELMDEAHRRYAPSELTCQSTSVGVGQTKAYQMSRAINRGFAKDISKQNGNTVGTPAAVGRGAEIKAQWDEFVAKFCDNTKGDQGCTTAGTRAGMHKDMPALLWGDKQTINLKDEPDNAIMVQAALRYLVYPASPDPIPPGAVVSAPGHQAILDRRADQARSNAVLNAVGQMLSERVGVKQDSGMNSTFRLMRQASGISDENISDDPSYSEIRDAVTKDRFLNPEYVVNMISNPEQVVREQGSINAIRMQLMNDLYRRSEEALFMEAAAYSFDLDKQMPSSSVGSAPLKQQQ